MKHFIHCVLTLILVINTSYADDFIPESEEDYTISANVFTLDGDNTGGDITLQFGATLGEVLSWDDVNSRFMLSSSLDLQGNQLRNIRIDNQATAPTCGAADEGKIYFNTADKLTYSCDGAGTWNPFENALNATIEFPLVQARRTTSFPLTAAYTDVDLDTTDLENDATSLDHDNTLRDRINIGADGLYQIIYGYTAGGTATATHEARARVRVNDTTVITGSASVNKNYQGEFSTTSASFLTNLSAGDFITLQLFRNNVTDATQDEIYFSIVKLEGIKGEKGDPGVPGSVGLGTNENNFTLDQDDTGGNVSLIFGTTLNESLTWDSTNNEFDLSDDLNILGTLQTINLTVGNDCGPYGVFWAERGGITSNQSWAMGNGQTPRGSVMGCSGTVQRFAATCTGAIGTSLGAEVRINNVASACSVSIPNSVGGVANAACNVSFGANDIVGVYAQTEVGNWTECVGTFWVKYD